VAQEEAVTVVCLWCVAGEPGPCLCQRDCGARPGVLGSPGCPLRPGNDEWPAAAWPLGPATTRLYQMELDPVPPACLDGGEAEAAAIGERVRSARRSCVLCSRREAVIALLVRVNWGRRRGFAGWADLCHPCYALVREEAAALPFLSGPRHPS
jgi:hypothetical protein